MNHCAQNSSHLKNIATVLLLTVVAFLGLLFCFHMFVISCDMLNEYIYEALCPNITPSAHHETAIPCYPVSHHYYASGWKICPCHLSLNWPAYLYYHQVQNKAPPPPSCLLWRSSTKTLCCQCQACNPSSHLFQG